MLQANDEDMSASIAQVQAQASFLLDSRAELLCMASRLRGGCYESFIKLQPENGQ